MKQIGLLLILLLLTNIGSAEAFKGANLEAGKRKANQVCANCHGLTGQASTGGNAVFSPKLTPQTGEYIEMKLMAYRSGQIQHPQMSLIAQMISEEDIRDVSAWYGGIKLKGYRFTEEHGIGVAGPTPDQISAREKISTLCAPCHGMDGIAEDGGDGPVIPNLIGQQKEYMVLRLKDYQEDRMVSPIMTPIAKTLTSQDIEHVAEWYSSIEIQIEEH